MVVPWYRFMSDGEHGSRMSKMRIKQTLSAIIFFLIAGTYFVGCMNTLFVAWIVTADHVWRVWVGILLLIIVAPFAIRFTKAVKRRTSQCPHGVRRAVPCPECVLEFERMRLLVEKQQLTQQKRQQEAERLRLIAEAADKLEREEANRFQQYMLSNVDYLRALTASEFEDAIADMLQRTGYAVKKTGRTNDRGRDGIAKINGRVFAYECKHYAANRKIGRPLIQKFHSSMIDANADAGMFFTTSSFADRARAYAKSLSIQLVDMIELVEWMRRIERHDSERNIIRIMCRQCGQVEAIRLNHRATQRMCTCGEPIVCDIDLNHRISHTLVPNLSS